jgi:uncharacterized protein (UPF0264 family)
LLVSVRDAAEAREALTGGADLIDVKDPGQGALGAADAQAIEAVAVEVRGRRPVSVAAGEWDGVGMAELPAGVHYVKIGLAGARGRSWQGALAHRFARLRPAAPIAVAYADGPRVAAPAVQGVLDWAIGHGAAGILIDTAVKDGSHLFDWVSVPTLAGWIERARRCGLMVALAGSLRGQAFERAIDLEPDVVAVRGAACAGEDRTDRVSRCCVARLAELISGRNVLAVQPAG